MSNLPGRDQPTDALEVRPEPQAQASVARPGSDEDGGRSVNGSTRGRGAAQPSAQRGFDSRRPPLFSCPHYKECW